MHQKFFQSNRDVLLKLLCVDRESQEGWLVLRASNVVEIVPTPDRLDIEWTNSKTHATLSL